MYEFIKISQNDGALLTVDEIIDSIKKMPKFASYQFIIGDEDKFAVKIEKIHSSKYKYNPKMLTMTLDDDRYVARVIYKRRLLQTFDGDINEVKRRLLNYLPRLKRLEENNNEI